MTSRIMALSVFIALGVTSTIAAAMNVDYPAGATLDATMRNWITTKTARDGQLFTAVTASGTRINGHLSEVERANFGRKAHLKLNIDTIVFTDGTSSSMDAEVIDVSQKKQPNYVKGAATVLGSMIAGNIIGKALGTNIGGLVGIAGGSLLAVNTSQDIVIPSGSLIRLKLNAPLILGSRAR